MEVLFLGKIFDVKFSPDLYILSSPELKKVVLEFSLYVRVYVRMCVRVYVRACVRACVRAFVRACVNASRIFSAFYLQN